MQHQMNTHGHMYVCCTAETGEIRECEKLPPILKILREETGYKFKIPHGNKVRTIILEEGVCNIYDMGKKLYEITVKRW